MATQHAAIVYNPGKVSLDDVRRVVDAEQERLGWEVSQWYGTDGDDSGRRAAEQALAGDPAVILVAGGDGTVRAVGDVVHGSETPLALVPSGTGNLLARNLGLPLGDLERSVRVAFAGATRAIDVAIADVEDDAGVRSRHAFLVMAGIGLDAEMAENTSALAKKHLGWLAYVTPIARSVLGNRQFQMRYRVDAERVHATRAHTVIIGNCGTLTGNMLLLPAAAVDDGLLDVVMLSPKGRFGWVRIGTRLTVQGLARRSRISRRMLALAPDLRALVYAQGRQFVVRFETPHGIELDGDSLGPVLGARVTVRPGALRVCVEPADAA